MEEISLVQSIVTLKSRYQCHMKITVLENSDTEKVIPTETLFGSTHQIQFLTPLELVNLTNQEEQNLPSIQDNQYNKYSFRESKIKKARKGYSSHLQNLLTKVDLDGLNKTKKTFLCSHLSRRQIYFVKERTISTASTII